MKSIQKMNGFLNLEFQLESSMELLVLSFLSATLPKAVYDRLVYSLKLPDSRASCSVGHACVFTVASPDAFFKVKLKIRCYEPLDPFLQWGDVVV